MNANYQGQRNEQAAIWINFSEKEAIKAEKVADKMMEYGYGFAHSEEDDYFMLVASDVNTTISQMKEDYKIAKKEALN